jgi:hypothetical protein
MNIGKTYFDIITSESVVDISTCDIGDHNYWKIRVKDFLILFLLILVIK